MITESLTSVPPWWFAGSRARLAAGPKSTPDGVPDGSGGSRPRTRTCSTSLSRRGGTPQGEGMTEPSTDNDRPQTSTRDPEELRRRLESWLAGQLGPGHRDRWCRAAHPRTQRHVERDGAVRPGARPRAARADPAVRGPVGARGRRPCPSSPPTTSTSSSGSCAWSASAPAVPVPRGAVVRARRRRRSARPSS